MMVVTYYDILNWVFRSLPGPNQRIRWKIAYYYMTRFDPKDYPYVLNVAGSYLRLPSTRNNKYAAFRKTFHYFAGSFEDKTAGQYVTPYYFKYR